MRNLGIFSVELTADISNDPNAIYELYAKHGDEIDPANPPAMLMGLEEGELKELTNQLKEMNTADFNYTMKYHARYALNDAYAADYAKGQYVEPDNFEATAEYRDFGKYADIVQKSADEYHRAGTDAEKQAIKADYPGRASEVMNDINEKIETLEESVTKMKAENQLCVTVEPLVPTTPTQ